jgi:endonuclease/exonuclease/phosphatase family metal-dependent hydrolase
MANSLKLLSWNIEKYGAEKLADPNMLNFVCTVIKMTGADVVGLMELVGWQGNETRDALVKCLNNHEALNKTGIIWAGVASEMTPSRPNEQYAFLWKTNVLTVQGWQLWNVVGEELFDSFFKANKLDAVWQENFWKSLFTNGWIDAAFQLKKRDLLTVDYKNFDLTKKAPSLVLTDPQKKTLVDLLLKEKPVTFPQKGSRPPFLLAGTVGKNIPVLLVLFHAPGPGSGLPVIASNMLSFMGPVREYAVAVVMGDFNVDAKTCLTPITMEYFDTTAGRLQYVRTSTGGFVNGLPFQRLTGPKFALTAQDPDLSLVLDYGGRLASAKTSLSDTLAATNQTADDTAVQAILKSEYDRFFVRAPKADPSTPFAWNLADAMVPKQVPVPGNAGPVMQTRSTTKTPYVASLATAAARAFDAWWDGQNAKTKKSSAAQAILQAAPKFGGSAVPSSLRQAQYTYLYAISDHLPIVMELQYA